MTEKTDPLFVSLGDLTRHATVSCIDGRHSDCIVGAPGGNMGEFILLLTSLEDATGARIDLEETRRIFCDFLKEFGRFYKHTDQHALDWIASQLGRDTLSARDIEEASPEDREKLLPLLLVPEGVGCGHIKAMLTSPELYQVRKELVENTLSVYFEALWRLNDSTKLDYVVLEGDHDETEFVVFEADDPESLSASTSIPLACKTHDHESRFVLHDAARRFLLVRAKEFFRNECRLSESQYEVFRARVNELADIQLEATRQALFPELPRRVVRITG